MKAIGSWQFSDDSRTARVWPDGPRRRSRHPARLTTPSHEENTVTETIIDPAIETPPAERLITPLRHVDLAVPDYERPLEFSQTTWKHKAQTTETGRAFPAATGSPAPSSAPPPRPP